MTDIGDDRRNGDVRVPTPPSVEQETLDRENIQHRVRNILAIVRSIFMRTAATSENIEIMVEHFIGRLDVIGRYQIASSFHLGAMTDVETMVCDEMLTFQVARDGRITAQGAETRLNCEAAQWIGLALHELFTNSVKFGVLSVASPQAALVINWGTSSEGVYLRWRETGIPLVVAAPMHYGFGREFIEQALPYQLGASTRFEIAPGRLDCDIIFPPG